ncbi:hypothetical protein SUGI_0774240 [Cryptomeria japonica]|nr:hypothetical protein SUGI_0774240 [Cryptomeria japonica]
MFVVNCAQFPPQEYVTPPAFVSAMENEETGDLLLPCTFCTKNCFAIHGKRKERLDGVSYFFKVMLGDFAQKLRIPPAIYPEFRNEIGIGTNVVLQGPSSQRWDVKLCGTDTQMEFAQGWEKFVHHHRIEFGDFLVFKYIYKSCFKVRIFGRSGCEKKTTFLNPQNTCHHCECPTTTNASSAVEISDQPMNNQMSIVMVSDKERNNRAQAISEMEGKKRRGRPPKRQQILTEKRNYRKPCYISCRRPVTEAERKQVLEAAVSFTSIRPFYLVIMTQSYVYSGFWLRVSKSCADSLQLPQERTQLTLVDPNSKEWHVQYLGHLERAALSGGWGHFSRGNNLEEGDACIFERIDNNKKKVKLKVHIFRVVKECTPYKRVNGRQLNDKLGSYKNMEVSREDLASNFSVENLGHEQEDLGQQRIKQMQLKKDRAATKSNKHKLTKSNWTPSTSDGEIVCRRSRRFAETCNLVQRPKKDLLCLVSSIDGQQSILRDAMMLSKKTISLDDVNDSCNEEDLMIIWDSRDASHTIPSSSEALIPCGESSHKGVLMTKSILPILDTKSEALDLVVALSPGEAGSPVDKKGEANWLTGSGMSDKTGPL